jgi:hypothetical protein
VVDKVALVQVFSEYFTITLTYHLGLVQQASSDRSTESPRAQIKKKVSCRLLDVSFEHLPLCCFKAAP